MPETIIDPDKLSRIVMLVFGKMDHGGPYWCYVAVKPSRYDDFLAAMHSETYNIQEFESHEYGEVIVSGEGKTPPGEITQKVAEMFGVPVSELFKGTDPKAVIAKKMKELKGS